MTAIHPDHHPAGTIDTGRSGGRIGDIEVLRAFAILLVLYEHADPSLVFWDNPFMRVARQYLRGWAGVDLFFAISGSSSREVFFPS